MAPLWKAMLSKSSPLYRDSLFSFSLWEWKAQERELLLLKKLTDRERRALLAQLDKLSKELQQKDKVIESLRTKLNQHHNHHHPHRSDTPCSSHALSDTTDQSDRISYVSDEHGSINEDLELCSDLDAVSELGQKETHSSTKLGTGFSTPQSKPLQGFPFAHQQPDSSAFLPLSFHGYQPSPFSSATSGSLDASSAMKAGASLLESSALWDMAYGPRPVRLGADLSSGSSGYQSGASNTGSDLMKEHLKEIRSLRQRLEDSIQTNDRLRQQLEERLARTATEKGAPTNIYIQGLDSVSQLSSEIRILKEENLSLQNQLREATREGSKEAQQLKEAALLDRAKLKEAELEAVRWAEQIRNQQSEAEARGQEISQLKQERQRNQEAVSRLQHEASVLQQQLSESHGLVHSLQSELQMYHRVCGVPPNTQTGKAGEDAHLERSMATFDPRELHLQLEQQLVGQADSQPRSRRKLFNDNVPSPPVRDTGLISPSSPLHPAQRQEEGPAEDRGAASLQAPNGSFANCHGRHAVGHIDDFKALQQQILEGSALLRKMEVSLCSLTTTQEFRLHQLSDSSSVRKFLSDTKTLRQILEESDSLIRMFWRAALPDKTVGKQDRSLREEVASLRLRLSEKEEALKDAMERVKSSNRTKDSMEHFIVSQLSRTRDVLRTAKTNLQVSVSDLCPVSRDRAIIRAERPLTCLLLFPPTPAESPQENQLRISSLRPASLPTPPSSSPSSFPSSSSSSSSSSHPWLSKGQNTGCFRDFTFSPGRGVVRPRTSSTSSFSAGQGAAQQQQRPLQSAFL